MPLLLGFAPTSELRHDNAKIVAMVRQISIATMVESRHSIYYSELLQHPSSILALQRGGQMRHIIYCLISPLFFT